MASVAADNKVRHTISLPMCLIVACCLCNRFMQAFCSGDANHLLHPSTISAMLTSQTHLVASAATGSGLPRPPIEWIPGVLALRQRLGLHVQEVMAHNDTPPSCWGLGFRLNHAERRFGELSPSTLFGHHGATGCMMWGHAASGVSCAVLSNLPELCYSLEFNKLSDLVCSALEI